MIFDYEKLNKAENNSDMIEVFKNTLENTEDFDFEDSEISKNLVQFINFIVKKASRRVVESANNIVFLEKENLKDAVKNATETKKEVDSIIENQDIVLQREIATTARLDITNIDMNKPVIVVINYKVIQQLQNVDKLNIDLGIAEITLNTSSMKKELRNKDELRIEIKINEEGNYEIIFTDTDGNPISQIEENIEVKLSIKDKSPEFSAVFYNDGKNIEQLGGQYDSNEKKIGFYTKNTGEYYILEKKKSYKDISHLPKEKQDAILFMASKGFISDRTDNIFDPNAEITRAEMTTLLVKAFYVLDKTLSTSFIDVSKDDWYYKYVVSSEKEGIIKGYPDQTFRGNDIINREQIVAVCARALHEKKKYLYPENIDEFLSFLDNNEISGWAKKEVALAYREKLIDMPVERTFVPQKAMTRADATLIAYRLF